MTGPGGVADGERWALVALNMGGPDRIEAVEPFLRNLLADRDMIRLPAPMRPFQNLFARIIAKRRAKFVRRNYEHLGGGSPLLMWTEKQAQLIADGLGGLGVPTTPLVAMRYWHPFADEVAAKLRELKPSGIFVVSLYPQYSSATGGSSIKDLEQSLDRAGVTGAHRIVVDRFPTLDGYLDATAASVMREIEAMGEPRPHVQFSAHGLPQAYVDRGDPYRQEIEQTYRGVVSRLQGPIECTLSFQSRVGPQEWLRPYTDDHVRELAARGVKRLLMIPLAFVSDHVETIYEMEEEYGTLARRLGMEYRRAPALNDDAIFTGALAGLLHARWRESAPGRAAAAASAAQRG